MSTVKVTGFKELDAELAKMEIKIQKKVLRKVVREGAKVVQKQAKANAPVSSNRLAGMKYKTQSGNLKKGIIVRAAKQKDIGKGVIGAMVTLKPTAWYGQLVEFGHKLMRKNKQFAHVPPNPFMRRAFDSTKQAVLAKMKTTFLKELGKYKRG